MGGSSGAHFGSGMTALTTSPDFSPNLDQWKWRAQEDKAVNTERKALYSELSTLCLKSTASKEKAKAARKAAAEKAFKERQQGFAQSERAEEALQRKYRAEGLAKPTLGDPTLTTYANRKAIEAKSVLDEVSVGRWLWSTPKLYPDFEVHGVGAEHEEAMLTLPYNASDKTVQSYVDNIVGNSRELTSKAVETRKHRDAEKAEAEERAKAEREAEADKRRAALISRDKAAHDARVARAYQIKKEMAEETRKQAKADADAAQKRFEKGLTQRKENVNKLHFMETDDLRSEAEIANERREGTSMNEGGRAEFRAAMLEGDAAKKEEFM